MIEVCTRTMHIHTSLRYISGTIKTIKDARIAVFSVEIEATATENKGTVLIESSEQLLNYNRSEEDAMDKVSHRLPNNRRPFCRGCHSDASSPLWLCLRTRR